MLLEDFEVRQEATVVPTGTVSFRIRNQADDPRAHRRTNRTVPDKLPLQSDGLTADEEGRGIKFLEEVDGLDIDDRETLVLDLAPGHYVLYCNLEGHYLGGCMRRSPSAEVGAASATRRTAAGGRSGIGRLVPRLPILGDLRLGRRLGWVIPVLIVLVAAIVVYNARAIASSVARRWLSTPPRASGLVERYTTDVLLVVDGFQADPEESAEDVREPVDVLLDGGSVRAPQGDGSRVEIPPARDWRVRRKLEQDRRLIDELIRTGDRLLDGGREDPSYEANVTHCGC